MNILKILHRIWQLVLWVFLGTVTKFTATGTWRHFNLNLEPCECDTKYHRKKWPIGVARAVSGPTK